MTTWSDVRNTVAKAAPGLGSMLGGPAGAGVGTLIAKALGTDEDPDAIMQSLLSDPEAQVKLRQIEVELKTKLAQHQSDVITAEAEGESWLQRNWRPIIMMVFAVMLIGHWYGFTPDTLSDHVVSRAFDVLEIGIGGYILGRSAEKITKTATGTGLLDRLKTR